MNLLRTLSAFAAVAVMVSGSVIAQEECTQCPHSTATATAAKACAACPHATAGKTCAACPSSTVAIQDGEKACPVSTAMANLPKMTYKVGDEATCCSDSAAALAKKNEAPIHFVVAEKTYEDKGAAYTALVATTETFVKDFTSLHTCDESGAHTVAGHSCNCPVTAGAHVKMVNAAMEKVSMSYAVGEHTCNCPSEAGALAKKADGEVVYVVGDAKTSCEMTARINLAHAKYKAAVQAVVAATTKEKKKDS